MDVIPAQPSSMFMDVIPAQPSSMLMDVIHGGFQLAPFKPSYGDKEPVVYKDELKKLTDASLAYYNSRHQRRFVLVEPLYLNFVTGLMDPDPGYDHLSFIAMDVNPPHKLKLFFAEVHSVETEETYIPYVKCCTPVEPDTPFFTLGCGSCHPHGVVYHPLGRYNAGGSCEDSSPYPHMRRAEKSAKRLLRDKYTFKSSNEYLSPDEDKDFRKMVDGYARKALKSYRIGLKCSYELVKVLKAVRFSDTESRCMEDGEAWVHMLFLARDTLRAAPLVLFFAEYSIDCDLVTTSGIMRVADFGSKVVTNCRLCSEVCPMVHPEGEYFAGIDGGTFVDALDEYRSWGVRVYLEEKQPQVAAQPDLRIMEQ